MLPKDACYLTIKETADTLRVTIRTIYNLINRGEIPFKQVGKTKLVPARYILKLDKEDNKKIVFSSFCCEKCGNFMKSLGVVEGKERFQCVMCFYEVIVHDIMSHIKKYRLDHENGKVKEREENQLYCECGDIYIYYHSMEGIERPSGKEVKADIVKCKGCGKTKRIEKEEK